MTPTLRRRSLVPLVALLALAVLVASACSPEQMRTLDLINQSRTQAGVQTLVAHPMANTKAQAWAEHLAAIGTLQHSNLADGMNPGWRVIAENVGVGGSIEQVQQGFLGSSRHRANMLDGRFNWAGTGVAVAGDGRVFVVQVFAQY